ncbi:Nucleotide-binding protein 2 [Phlyctochytrium planicorne]|nr:Nucleotide-binding protein 2 [Phlyctochytrium planicorne]
MTTEDTGITNIKHILLVLSGKGGVGKSTVTAELALTLWNRGTRKVGILDVDLTGPSMPRILGLQNRQVHQGTNGWIPVWADREGGLRCMSIGFLLKGKDDAVVWRGPKKTDVVWGDLDYLIIDTPPGTSDEHISLMEYLKEYNPAGAVVVTTPQEISVLDVKKELSFCRKVGLKVLGIVENMSGYVCPHCSECTNLFSKGGGQRLADKHKIPFLGHVPIDPNLVLAIESAETSTEDGVVKEGGFVASFDKSGLQPVFSEIVGKVVKMVEGEDGDIDVKKADESQIEKEKA